MTGGIIFLSYNTKAIDMQTDNTNSGKENPGGQNAGKQADSAAKENAAAAHDEADKDIENDPDLAATNDPAADLDEGELARLDNSNDEVDI